LVESRTLVQTFGIRETKRSEHYAAHVARTAFQITGRFVSNTKLSQIERTFLDPMREFNAAMVIEADLSQTLRTDAWL